MNESKQLWQEECNQLSKNGRKRIQPIDNGMTFSNDYINGSRYFGMQRCRKNRRCERLTISRRRNGLLTLRGLDTLKHAIMLEGHPLGSGNWISCNHCYLFDYNDRSPVMLYLAIPISSVVIVRRSRGATWWSSAGNEPRAVWICTWLTVTSDGAREPIDNTYKMDLQLTWVPHQDITYSSKQKTNKTKIRCHSSGATRRLHLGVTSVYRHVVD